MAVGVNKNNPLDRVSAKLPALSNGIAATREAVVELRNSRKDSTSPRDKKRIWCST